MFQSCGDILYSDVKNVLAEYFCKANGHAAGGIQKPRQLSLDGIIVPWETAS